MIVEYKNFIKESAKPIESIYGDVTEHYSVGGIIIKEGQLLMIDRKKPPFGWACVAGHVDEGETPLRALYREVKEETGLIVRNTRLLLDEKINNNFCSRGIGVHNWRVYRCEVNDGEPILNQDEVKHIDWIDVLDIENLTLEPVWRYFLKKLSII